MGQPGNLRQPIGGQGQWHAPRPRNRDGLHHGLDIAGVRGQSPVFANRSGTVQAAGWGGSDAGYRVRIDHGNGVIGRYAHLHPGSIPSGLVAGQQVAQGQQIGVVGTSGNAGNTPPHLHFNVVGKQGELDPEQYLNSPCPK